MQTVHQKCKAIRKASELFPYCKCSIEKFIYKKMTPKIMKLYTIKYKAEDELYHKKKEAVLKKTPKENVANLGMKEYLIGKEEMIYRKSIDSLNKIETQMQPYKKLLCVHEAVMLMKLNVFENSNGKNELNSMDDYLPVMIYCLVYCELTAPSSEFHVMKDYLALLKGDHESEIMMLTHFMAALTFINSQWKIE